MEALSVAKYIINYALENRKPVSNLQLQKILYFLDGEYFSKTNQFLINTNEVFVAYPLGPVMDLVYQIYKGYGASKIFDKSEADLNPDVNKKIVDDILDRRIGMSAHELVDESHEIGKAWDRTQKTKGLYRDIDRKWMQEDFAHA